MMNALRSLRSLCIPVAVLSGLAVFPIASSGQTKKDTKVTVPVVSDWTHHHLLFPESKDAAKTARVKQDKRWTDAWYSRHTDSWWPNYHPRLRRNQKKDAATRDWNITLGTTTFEPMYDFNFAIVTQAGFGSLNTTDEGNGSFLATAGSLTVTGLQDIGTYPLYAGGPAITTSPNGQFIFDNLLFPTYPTINPPIDVDGLLFVNSSGFEVNLWANSAAQYEYDDTGYVNDQKGTPFTLSVDPGAGQTAPAKFNFDVSSAPDCVKDYLVMGIASNPVSGGQANIIGVNNLYTEPGGTGFCSGTGPTVTFAYASASGEIPGGVAISQFGNQVAYVENRLTGSSYFHVLTIGTTGNNGSSATSSVVPGAGNNAVDASVVLSPDNGVTVQSSTSSPFIVYKQSEINDTAYVTTYSTTGTGSGYLYKLTNVFAGATTPRIVWSVPISAIPSSPVYDAVSNTIFLTDSAGRIDSAVDPGLIAPVVNYGSVVGAGTTSENAVVVDSTNQMVYATFNSNGTNAVVVQATEALATLATIPVGTANTIFGSPYAPEFNNAFYTGAGIPQMYVEGTGSGTTPTLYGVNFMAGGNSALNPGSVQSTALATGMADSTGLTEFYNPTLARDFLFAGVTNNCVATAGGGTAGCVMSLNVTTGFPVVGTGTTALAAAGGPTGVIVDNDSSASQASSIYYATKTGSTLVKATQALLQ